MRVTRYGNRPLVSVNSELYQKYKNQPNFQAFADQQMGRLIAAQQRRHNPEFFGGKVSEIKPSNLYQEYLKKSGMMQQTNKPPPSKSDQPIWRRRGKSTSSTCRSQSVSPT